MKIEAGEQLNKVSSGNMITQLMRGVKEYTINQLVEQRRLDLAELFTGETSKQLAEKLRKVPLGSPQAGKTIKQFANELADRARNRAAQTLAPQLRSPYIEGADLPENQQ